MQRVQQARRFWDRLDHKLLFRMLAYVPILVPGLPLMVAATKGVEIGEFVKQYGAFRLYRHS